ncbi:tail fiber domain-containing protein [Pararhodobacter sp.]|uniref:tail fiber domain-containing protein n=1 Tax=Pararhodobacter sp. TaxID=2127056 RepID=UPI002AFE06EB|nr:tail fiber domain-containing protein [Pararhodobacter sp.]
MTLAGTEEYRFSLATLTPLTDNARALGSGAFRWSQLYAGSGTINTSDIREKQQQHPLSDKERAVAVRLKSLVRAFKWNKSVEEKGKNARWHFGVMAQEVADAFTSEGLDAHDYGLFCYDEWSEHSEVKDSEGNILEPLRQAGNRYGIRYDELIVFILGASS